MPAPHPVAGAITYSVGASNPFGFALGATIGALMGAAFGFGRKGGREVEHRHVENVHVDDYYRELCKNHDRMRNYKQFLADNEYEKHLLKTNPAEHTKYMGKYFDDRVLKEREHYNSTRIPAMKKAAPNCQWSQNRLDAWEQNKHGLYFQSLLPYDVGNVLKLNELDLHPHDSSYWIDRPPLSVSHPRFHEEMSKVPSEVRNKGYADMLQAWAELPAIDYLNNKHKDIVSSGSFHNFLKKNSESSLLFKNKPITSNVLTGSDCRKAIRDAYQHAINLRDSEYGALNRKLDELRYQKEVMYDDVTLMAQNTPKQFSGQFWVGNELLATRNHIDSVFDTTEAHLLSEKEKLEYLIGHLQEKLKNTQAIYTTELKSTLKKQFINSLDTEIRERDKKSVREAFGVLANNAKQLNHNDKLRNILSVKDVYASLTEQPASSIDYGLLATDVEKDNRRFLNKQPDKTIANETYNKIRDIYFKDLAKTSFGASPEHKNKNHAAYIAYNAEKTSMDIFNKIKSIKEYDNIDRGNKYGLKSLKERRKNLISEHADIENRFLNFKNKNRESFNQLENELILHKNAYKKDKKDFLNMLKNSNLSRDDFELAISELLTRHTHIIKPLIEEQNRLTDYLDSAYKEKEKHQSDLKQELDNFDKKYTLLEGIANKQYNNIDGAYTTIKDRAKDLKQIQHGPNTVENLYETINKARREQSQDFLRTQFVNTQNEATSYIKKFPNKQEVYGSYMDAINNTIKRLQKLGMVSSDDFAANYHLAKHALASIVERYDKCLQTVEKPTESAKEQFIQATKPVEKPTKSAKEQFIQAIKPVEKPTKSAKEQFIQATKPVEKPTESAKEQFIQAIKPVEKPTKSAKEQFIQAIKPVEKPTKSAKEQFIQAIKSKETHEEQPHTASDQAKKWSTRFNELAEQSARRAKFTELADQMADKNSKRITDRKLRNLVEEVSNRNSVREFLQSLPLKDFVEVALQLTADKRYKARVKRIKQDNILRAQQEADEEVKRFNEARNRQDQYYRDEGYYEEVPRELRSYYVKKRSKKDTKKDTKKNNTHKKYLDEWRDELGLSDSETIQFRDPETWSDVSDEEAMARIGRKIKDRGYYDPEWADDELIYKKISKPLIDAKTALNNATRFGLEAHAFPNYTRSTNRFNTLKSRLLRSFDSNDSGSLHANYTLSKTPKDVFLDKVKNIIIEAKKPFDVKRPKNTTIKKIKNVAVKKNNLKVR